MSKRDVRLFLGDILDAIVKVEKYTAGLSFDDFQGNDMVVDSVTRNLEIIGEAAKQIPMDLRAQYTAIDWKRVCGFRDVAIHMYFAVDVEIVWTISTQQLVQLKQVVEQMFRDLSA